MKPRALYNVKRYISCFFLAVFVMAIFCCPPARSEEASSFKQQFLASIDGDLRKFRKLYDELQLLTELGLENEIDAKKIELYEVMARVLDSKRKVFQKKIEECENIYRELRDSDSKKIDVAALDSCHMQIKIYEQKINKISDYMKIFHGRKNAIVHFNETRSRMSIEDTDLEAEKEKIFVSLRQLVAKERNLYLAGASPDEISRIRRELQVLENRYRSVSIQIGYAETEIDTKLQALETAIDPDLSPDSLARKNRVDGYKYRFNERDAKKTITYNRINERGTSVRHLRMDSSLRFGTRVDGPRSDHNKPGKKF
jgi:septal ring factor EnvC (AmiA/AmiB activator)